MDCNGAAQTGRTGSLRPEEMKYDACGMGFVANIKGRKVTTLSKRASRLENLTHRGAVGAEQD